MAKKGRQPQKFSLVVGNLADGATEVLGPFSSKAEADEFASEDMGLREEGYVTLPCATPDEWLEGMLTIAE